MFNQHHGRMAISAIEIFLAMRGRPYMTLVLLYIAYLLLTLQSLKA